MKTIAASILVLLSVVYVSAQQVTDNLIEKRVPLTEAAVAFDASGAPALEATLRTTALNGAPDTEGTRAGAPRVPSPSRRGNRPTRSSRDRWPGAIELCRPDGKTPPGHVGLEDGHGRERADGQSGEACAGGQQGRIEPQPADACVKQPESGDGDQGQAGERDQQSLAGKIFHHHCQCKSPAIPPNSGRS